MCTLAGMWFAYLLVYGALPLWISGNIYALLADAVAPKPAFWLLLALVPVACVLPGFLLRSVGRRARWSKLRVGGPPVVQQCTPIIQHAEAFMTSSLLLADCRTCKIGPS